MLPERLKTQIQHCYNEIRQAMPGFNPRPQQKILIAEIAKTLAGSYDKQRRLITIEAGTGTGKSLAYCLGSIPLALSREKKVCISTATVTLQEQLIDKDLPFFKQHSGLEFSFTLVKGRHRYACKQKLASLHQADDDSPQSVLWTEKPDPADIKLIAELVTAVNNGKWAGDRDSWPTPINDKVWSQIQSDKHQCVRTMAGHQTCPYHQSRDAIDQADVLVINHSLLMSDLGLGGGVILPAVEDCIYIIDEAHHLPDTAREHASAAASLLGAVDWLNKLAEAADRVAKLVKTQAAISPALKLGDDCMELIAELQKTHQYLQANQTQFFAEADSHRFAHGILTKPLKSVAPTIALLADKCLNSTNKLFGLLTEAIKDSVISLKHAEPVIAECGFFIQRLENLAALWQLWAKTDSEKAAPMARWMERIEGKKADFLLSASPIDIGYTLDDQLWSQCYGAVLCSATLVALNSFDHFRHQVGLRQNDGSQYKRMDSPFDYQTNAVLAIPSMPSLPSDEQFTDDLVNKLKTLLVPDEATLVLFSSLWQMKQCAEKLRLAKFELLVQGERARQTLIAKHKAAVDAGKGSILFGSQSFSEGLDLPGDYLTHVIITKLPFAVPTSPVEEAHAEHITAKGGNPFMSITVPEASKKLIQACGRLLRSETDSGRITILDRRLVTKQYGSQMLASLPPFKRQIE